MISYDHAETMLSGILHGPTGKPRRDKRQLSLWDNDYENRLSDYSRAMASVRFNCRLKEYYKFMAPFWKHEKDIPNRKPCALYRHFNAEGVLLYVGISNDPDERIKAHKRTAHWFADIHSITVEWHVGLSKVLALEKDAIKKERPLHNGTHAIKELEQ